MKLASMLPALLVLAVSPPLMAEKIPQCGACTDTQIFQDVLDHVRRVDAMVNSLRDVLTSVFEVSNLLEQQRQGVITRQLAAWAAILAVPTAIAGIYGMNFENMPELKTQYGYFVVVGVIVVLCTVLYLRFKRARWL